MFQHQIDSENLSDMKHNQPQNRRKSGAAILPMPARNLCAAIILHGKTERASVKYHPAGIKPHCGVSLPQEPDTVAPHMLSSILL
jgi:hypothetical protein